MKEIVTCISWLLLSAGRAVSQQERSDSISIGYQLTLTSKVLKESRQVLIYGPRHRAEGVKYPVIYLLDGASLFYPAVGALHFLNYSTSMPPVPEAYIVGILNTDRNRDMPVPQAVLHNSGAANFYSFLSGELVPFINSQVAASGLNILVGHSQGGLLATYAAVQRPRVFSFIMALDAPMTVVAPVAQRLRKGLGESCSVKYISLKTVYGWDAQWDSSCTNHVQRNIEGESHETMPYKGIYEGLKFLFNDYWPPVKDGALSYLQDYYRALQIKYGVPYGIPAKVLLESARQHIGQSKKAAALALIGVHDSLYGTGTQSRQLKEKAEAITRGPDDRVQYHLSQPSPSEAVVGPFLGKWSGTVNVPDGTDFSIDWEIKGVNGRYRMVSEVMKEFTSTSDFLYVNEKGELVWGRKHEGGGIYLSVGALSPDGSTITGTEDLIGFEFPPEMPPFKKNRFRYKKQ